MRFVFGRFAQYVGHPAFRFAGLPAFAGISGGKTSGMMAALLDARVRLCFQNVGEEHDKTLEFLVRLEDALERPITWIEWRPPPRLGDPPRKFGFEVVNYQTATRNSNTLFRELMRYVAAYRATKGEAPLIPWARMRICTAYLKHRVMEHWIASQIGGDAHEWHVGLRADEPDRIAKLSERQRGARYFCTPLNDAGITKDGDLGVNAFWAQQAFNLEIEPHQGNCGGCFLKDEADISRAMGAPDADGEGFLELEREYPGWGGHGRWTYAQLKDELPTRLAIESALRAGAAPTDDGRLTPRRFKLVVRQEERRLREGSTGFTCACEQTVALADAESEDAA